MSYTPYPHPRILASPQIGHCSLSIVNFPGARLYHSTASVWLSVDPLSDKYPSVSPYVYCAGNPVRLVDPDGRDPIYGRVGQSFAKIGDDGKDDGNSYLVLGKAAAGVRAATAQGKNYDGDLSPSENVFLIPTNGILNDVQNTVERTHNSGNTVDERVEYGGHANVGDTRGRIWDPGTPMKLEGDEKKWSITPFRINGKDHQQGTPNSEDIMLIWHVQPNGSDPSKADYAAVSIWRKAGYKGCPFVVGDETKTVSYYNNQRKIVTIPYETFLKMGRREEIK